MIHFNLIFASFPYLTEFQISFKYLIQKRKQKTKQNKNVNRYLVLKAPEYDLRLCRCCYCCCCFHEKFVEPNSNLFHWMQ